MAGGSSAKMLGVYERGSATTTHLPDEDPDEPEPTGQDDAEAVAHEAPEAVALRRRVVDVVRVHGAVSFQETELEKMKACEEVAIH